MRDKIRALLAAVSMVVVMICGLAVYFPMRQIADAEHALQFRAEAYSAMLAVLSRSAVAFDDRETAREIFTSVAVDQGVSQLALYRQDGRPIYGLGVGLPARLAAATQPVVRLHGTYLEVVRPVLSPEGPRGTLVVSVSRAPVLAMKRAMRVTVGAVWALALLVGAAVAWAAATMSSLAKDAQQRSEALDARNKDTRLLLDNVEQGFLSLDRDGRVSPERSAAADRFLGPVTDGESLWEVFARIDPTLGERLRFGWQEVLEDILPVEITLDQLPRGFAREGAEYRCEYRPILRDGALQRVLVVITDVTRERESERAESRQRELLAVVRAVGRDRDGFVSFFSETSELVRRIAAGDPSAAVVSAETARDVHTLKGNCGLFGIVSVVSWCHDLENRIADDRLPPSAAERAALTECWSALSAAVAPFVGERADAGIEVTRVEHERLLARMASGEARVHLIRDVRAWTGEPAERRLSRLADQAIALGRRLGRAPLRIAVQGGGVRLSQESTRAFWSSMAHVIRNAVDHGIETAEERAAAGKSPEARVTLSACARDGEVVIEVSDDGRGINWSRVAARAQAAGLAHANRADLCAALLADGVSTRDEVSETSGRGVGLAAVRAACDALGGVIDIESAPGEGTRFRFVFPESRVAVAAEPVRAAPSLAPARVA